MSRWIWDLRIPDLVTSLRWDSFMFKHADNFEQASNPCCGLAVFDISLSVTFEEKSMKGGDLRPIFPLIEPI